MNHRAHRILSTALLLVTLAPSALAVPTTAAQHEKSRADFASGNEAFRAGQYENARLRYQSALASERAFDILCNLGRTEAVLGDDALALRHLDECLKEYPPGAETAAAREKFFTLREQVRTRCAERRCETTPAATDGTDAAAPAAATEPASQSSEPKGSEAASSESDSGSSSSARWWVAGGVGALGVAGLALGVGYFVASGNTSSTAEALRDDIAGDGGACGETGADPRCDAFLDQVELAREQHTIGIVGVSAGAALVAAGALLFGLWPSGGDSASGMRVVPQFGWSPGGAYGGLRGQF
ncbi:MAG TPA: hypothetical protein VLC09_10355 [Polyangiaceae bacterium]|nr:hypothetical protein [Polyangiaceae bacterium]